MCVCYSVYIYGISVSYRDKMILLQTKRCFSLQDIQKTFLCTMIYLHE
uniref:Uncharacterized protein n=1 Tax=Anguilla anguilla TaxID=7936 RepID=A0A0E9SDA0_ANGAN